MKDIKENGSLDNDIKAIIDSLEKAIIDKMKDIEKEDEDLEVSNIDVIKKQTSTVVSFNSILENILNYFLNKIKDLNVKEYFELTKRCYVNNERKNIPENYLKAERLIDDIMEYCNPLEKYNDVYEDAEYIAWSLMRKKLNINGLELPEPVNLEYIKFYACSSTTSPKEIDNTIWYMILFIATHYYVLKKLSK